MATEPGLHALRPEGPETYPIAPDRLIFPAGMLTPYRRPALCCDVGLIFLFSLPLMAFRHPDAG
jgi:hypothetical protein